MSLIKLNNSRCKSCYLCVNVCPRGLIKVSSVTNRLGDYLVEFEDKKPKNFPDDFWINYITATFIETLRWWIENKMKQTPEKITEYFLLLV